MAEGDKLTCLKCGATWVPRIPNPIKCPRCQQFWNTPKKR